MSGCDGSGVAAQVPLAHCPGLIAESAEVPGQQRQVGGEGVRGGAHQHVVLQTWHTRLQPGSRKKMPTYMSSLNEIKFQ